MHRMISLGDTPSKQLTDSPAASEIETPSSKEGKNGKSKYPDPPRKSRRLLLIAVPTAFAVFAVAGFLINIFERKIISRSLADAMGLTSHGRFSLT